MYIRDTQGNIMTDNRGFQRYDYGKKGQDTNGSRNTIPNANPLASYMLDKMKYSGDVVSGKWFADVDIWGGIKAKVNIGVDANNVRNTDMVNPFYGQYSETTGVGGLISVSTQRTFSVNQQYLLTYNKTFNDVHNLDVLAGHESYNYKYNIYMASVKNCIIRMFRNWIMVFQINITHLIQKIMQLKVGCSVFSMIMTENISVQLLIVVMLLLVSIRIIVGVTFGLLVQVGY